MFSSDKLNATKTVNPQMVKISVIDSGIGISKEAQKVLFTPFAQAAPSTKRQFGGTGTCCELNFEPKMDIDVPNFFFRLTIRSWTFNM